MTRIVMARREHDCHNCGARIKLWAYCGQIGRIFECARCLGIDLLTGKEPNGRPLDSVKRLPVR